MTNIETARIPNFVVEYNGKRTVIPIKGGLGISSFSCPLHIGGCRSNFCPHKNHTVVNGDVVFRFSDLRTCVSHPTFFQELDKYENKINEAINVDQKTIQRYKEGNCTLFEMFDLMNLHIDYAMFGNLYIIKLITEDKDLNDRQFIPDFYSKFRQIYGPVLFGKKNDEEPGKEKQLEMIVI